jgi:hypothetical protein
MLYVSTFTSLPIDFSHRLIFLLLQLRPTIRVHRIAKPLSTRYSIHRFIHSIHFISSVVTPPQDAFMRRVAARIAKSPCGGKMPTAKDRFDCNKGAEKNDQGQYVVQRHVLVAPYT